MKANPIRIGMDTAKSGFQLGCGAVKVDRGRILRQLSALGAFAPVVRPGRKADTSATR